METRVQTTPRRELVLLGRGHCQLLVHVLQVLEAVANAPGQGPSMFSTSSTGCHVTLLTQGERYYAQK